MLAHIQFITVLSPQLSGLQILVFSECLYALCFLLTTLLIKMSDCSPHNLTKRGSVLVQPPGIEPGSTVLQTAAMTTSARVAYWICKHGTSFISQHFTSIFFKAADWLEVRSNSWYLERAPYPVWTSPHMVFEAMLSQHLHLQNLVPRDRIELPTFSV